MSGISSLSVYLLEEDVPVLLLDEATPIISATCLSSFWPQLIGPKLLIGPISINLIFSSRMLELAHMNPNQSFLFVSLEMPYKIKGAAEITDFCALRNRENTWGKKNQHKEDLQKKAGKIMNILCQDDSGCK